MIHVTKLTQDIVNERLSNNKRGVDMIGDYVNARTKTMFKCLEGHQWLATPDSVLRGNGCPHCACQAKLTKEIVNQRIHDSGNRMIGKYTDSKTKTEFLCQYGHTWSSIPSHVMAGSGCPVCSHKQQLTEKDVKERLSELSITMVGMFTKMIGKTEFECKSGHRWKTSPNNILNNGTGCPICSDYGFNPNKPAWEYGFVRNGYLKIGITNDLRRRLNEHRKHGEFTLVHECLHEVGQLALDWERNIKQIYGGKYVTKEQCPDGYTETLPVSLLNVILEQQMKEINK